jgi:ribose 1,5-bisphosphokinase PhnN
MDHKPPAPSLQPAAPSPQAPRVVVVGPDAAGKSELVGRLRALGYNAGSCAQEHSYVPDMWRRLARPDFLIYLDARLETIAQRRAIDWGQERLDELNARLAHARAHCDFYLPTDDLEAPQVVERVCAALAAAGIVPARDEEAAGDDEV